MAERPRKRAGALVRLRAWAYAGGVVAALTVGGGLVLPSAAAASPTATMEVQSGTLEFLNGTPGNVSFPTKTLSGENLTVTAKQPFDVQDARGTGEGWSITATSTQFKTEGTSPHTLSASATTIASAPTVACNEGVTCTLAKDGVSYPYTLPAAGTEPPTATTMFSAEASSGMGDQTVTPTWTLSLPANAYAGTYNSTWTLTLASTP